MNHAFVGAADPFALTMDPSSYVPSSARERALAQLDTALEAGMVPCLEGPTGIGKSLLLRVFGERVAARFTPLYLPFPLLSARELCALALGLLGRSAALDPEAALEAVAAGLALNGRPLLLLLDDAASLPVDSARGLAAIVARARGRLRVALAGIGGAPLLRAVEPFGDALVRVALEEGVPDAALPGYVAAQLEHAHAPAKLREAFDDGALAELGRLAAGNPRRLHLAAQRIVRRAETALPAPRPLTTPAGPPPTPEAPPPPPATAGPLAAPSVLAEIVAAPTVLPGVAPHVAATAAPAAPAPDPPAPSSEAEPTAAAQESRHDAPTHPEPVEPAGEYRLVRGRAPDADAVPESHSESAPAPPMLLPPAQIDLTLAALLEPARPPAAPAKTRATPATGAPTTRRDGRRRAPSVGMVIVVAAISAVLGFALASQVERGRAGVRALVERIAPGLLDAPAPARSSPATQIPPVSTPAPIAPQSAAPAATTGVAAPATPEPEALEIQVSINAAPWARIEIDGEPVGETPLGDVSLRAGTHRFRALFPDGRVSERVVEIDAEHRRVVFE